MAVIDIPRRLLRKFGQPMTFTRAPDVEADPEDGSVSSDTEITDNGYGALTRYKIMDVNGVLKDAARVLYEANTTEFVPQVNDVLTADGINYEVLSVQRVPYKTVKVLYKVQVQV